MKTGTLILVLFTFFAMLSCNSEDDGEKTDLTECDFTTLINNDLYTEAPNDPLWINDLEINGNCLKITFSASGCDGNRWEVKLVDSEDIMESNPPQRNLRLSLNNPEDCTAVPTQTLTFDISDLQLPDNNEIYLNITNSDNQILYEY